MVPSNRVSSALRRRWWLLALLPAAGCVAIADIDGIEFAPEGAAGGAATGTIGTTGTGSGTGSGSATGSGGSATGSGVGGGSAGSGGAGVGGGGCQSKLPVTTDFTQWPSAWTVLNGGSSADDGWSHCVGNASDAFWCQVARAPDGTDGRYAAVGQPYEGNPQPELDEHLLSAPVNCSCDDTVWLEFDSYFSNRTNEQAYVVLEINGGDGVGVYQPPDSPDSHVAVDISTWAAHKSAVRVGFSYVTDGPDIGGWSVDNVTFRP